MAAAKSPPAIHLAAVGNPTRLRTTVLDAQVSRLRHADASLDGARASASVSDAQAAVSRRRRAPLDQASPTAAVCSAKPETRVPLAAPFASASSASSVGAHRPPPTSAEPVAAGSTRVRSRRSSCFAHTPRALARFRHVSCVHTRTPPWTRHRPSPIALRRHPGVTQSSFLALRPEWYPHNPRTARARSQPATAHASPPPWEMQKSVAPLAPFPQPSCWHLRPPPWAMHFPPARAPTAQPGTAHRRPRGRSTDRRRARREYTPRASTSGRRAWRRRDRGWRGSSSGTLVGRVSAAS